MCLCVCQVRLRYNFVVFFFFAMNKIMMQCMLIINKIIIKFNGWIKHDGSRDNVGFPATAMVTMVTILPEVLLEQKVLFVKTDCVLFVCLFVLHFTKWKSSFQIGKGLNWGVLFGKLDEGWFSHWRFGMSNQGDQFWSDARIPSPSQSPRVN